ncbi:MAG: T9SS type A sorting domain-containing protein [Candidatus Marinimicrobia bacterium]|nr:T9SS type A sorting domain-containing protein [Candidatus Neomarinimicrobiota bacterium]
MRDIIWAIGVSSSLELRSYFIIVIFYVFGYTSNFDSPEKITLAFNQTCLTDELFNNYSAENISKIIANREKVRRKMTTEIYRMSQDTISIPIVFHDIFRTIEDEVNKSFCNYIGGFNSGMSYNDVNFESCQERGYKALKILNEQFAPAKIKFIPNLDSLLIIAHSDDDYNFISTGVGGNVESIRRHYFIPNSLNIYMNYCILDTSDECSSISGMSTYPWGLDSNTPGITIRHSSFPGMNTDLKDNNSIAILPHELGHYFSLFHIEGIWMFNNDFKKEYVNGEECGIRGDLICDTPGQPGYSNGVFDTAINGENRNCIYHGYGGDYYPSNEILKLGNSQNIAEIGDYIYSNQDEHGDFWGTYEMADSCFLMTQNEFSTECPLSSYPNLPLSHNFLQPVVVSQYCGGVGFHEYNQGNGYTSEQFANILYSVEHDYTGCNIPNACNFDITSTHFLRLGESSCKFPCELDGGCLATDAEYQTDYTQYDCSGNSLSINTYRTPNEFRIAKLYPNPFNPIANLEYELTENTNLKITVYDISGKFVKLLFNSFQTAGIHSIVWNAMANPNGIYFINISTSNYSESQKIVLLK